MSNRGLSTITVAFLAFGMSVVVSVKILTGKTYVKLAAGIVDNPINVVPVLKTSQCARLCAKLKLCSAFSLRNNDMMNSTNDSKTDGDSKFECSLTQGQFTWTPDPTANIFGEILDGRYANGYSFARDGMLYKFLMTSNIDQMTTRMLCNKEAASIAVPYPNVSLQATQSLQMASSGRFYVGLTRTGSHAEGRWVTDDGHIFFVTSQTTAQVRWLFAGNQPDGDGPAAEMWLPGRLLNDLSPGLNIATSLTCRKEIYFMRSSINGKFYRLFRNKRTYAQAVESCASFGGTLANVYSAGDFNATEGYRLQTMFFAQPALEGFWVGGTDEDVEGTWILPDGTRMLEAERMTDTNQIRLWATGQPTTGQSANCLSISSARGNAQACNSTFRYLCEAVLN